MLGVHKSLERTDEKRLVDLLRLLAAADWER